MPRNQFFFSSSYKEKMLSFFRDRKQKLKGKASALTSGHVVFSFIELPTRKLPTVQLPRCRITLQLSVASPCPLGADLPYPKGLWQTVNTLQCERSSETPNDQTLPSRNERQTFAIGFSADKHRVVVYLVHESGLIFCTGLQIQSTLRLVPTFCTCCRLPMVVGKEIFESIHWTCSFH